MKEINPQSALSPFTSHLVYLSYNSLQEFNRDPVMPPLSSRPDHVEKALKNRFHDAMNRIPGKELDLLIVILPDNNGSLYGM